jgi:soluble lytic murein transglycosylase
MTIIRRALRQLAFLLVGLLLIIGLIKFSPMLWRLVYPLQHQSVIMAEAKRQELDPNLIAAVINVESRWQARAVSPKGASGLMQLMPITAEWVADQAGLQGFQTEDLFLPEVNIQLGTWYLANLLNEFDHNLVVAIAAYNGGRGNVEQWLQERVWDGTLDDVQSIPFSETRKYVTKVINQFHIYSRLYSWESDEKE